MSASSDEKRVSRMRERLEKLADDARDLDDSEPSGGKNVSVIESARRRAIQMLPVVLVLAGLSWAFGSLITPQTGILLFFALTGFSMAADKVGGFSFAFGLSMVGVVALLNMVAPPWLANVFAPAFAFAASVTGVPINQFNPAFVVGAVVTAITVMWLVDIRVASAFYRSRPFAATPRTTAKVFGKRTRELFEDYTEIAVFATFTLFMFAVILLQQLNILGGMMFDVIGEAPVLAGSVFTNIIAYLSLGGSVGPAETWPIIGTIIDVAGSVGPVAFALIAMGVLALAAFAKEARS